VEDKDSQYNFFLTKIGYLRETMSSDMKKFILEHFDPLFMLNIRGKEVEHGELSSFLAGEEIDVKKGVIVFMRREM